MSDKITVTAIQAFSTWHGGGLVTLAVGETSEPLPIPFANWLIESGLAQATPAKTKPAPHKAGPPAANPAEE